MAAITGRNPEFQTHKLNDVGMSRAKAVGEAFDDLLDKLVQAGCDSSPRFLAIVKTKLEEACFFAKKALAQQTTNQAKD